MIDFTTLPQRNKTYGGANGSKICVVYEDELYMLKFPAPAKQNKDMSYANGNFSEYLGCHIFDSVGIEVQKTLLGTYNVNGEDKIVVACRDFTSPGIILQDFASLKNTIIDSTYNGYGTELDDIIDAMEEQHSLEPSELKDWFWNVFIIDALIGNWDRHNGNWGFLYNTATDEIKLAPIYDCGSCLFPQADEELMQKIMNNEDERNLRIYERPLSGIKINNQKINYHKFISSCSYDDCNKALKRMQPKIDMAKISNIIDDMPYATELQKNFYKLMIKERKEKIIDLTYEKLKKRERKNKLSR